jgi:hypothetical protein
MSTESAATEFVGFTERAREWAASASETSRRLEASREQMRRLRQELKAIRSAQGIAEEPSALEEVPVIVPSTLPTFALAAETLVTAALEAPTAPEPIAEAVAEAVLWHVPVPEPIVAAVEEAPVVAALEPEPIVAAVEEALVVAAPEPDPIVAAVEEAPVVAVPEPEPIVAAVVAVPVLEAPAPESELVVAAVQRFAWSGRLPRLMKYSAALATVLLISHSIASGWDTRRKDAGRAVAPAVLEPQSQEALALVRAWSLSGDDKTVLERLGGVLEHPGGVRAWSAESTGEDTQLVIYREAGLTPVYVFEVDLKSRRVHAAPETVERMTLMRVRDDAAQRLRELPR